MTTYLLHVTSPSGVHQTLTFPDPCTRALVVITLSAQPVTVRVEDREAVVEVALVPIAESCGPVVDVALVPTRGGRS